MTEGHGFRTKGVLAKGGSQAMRALAGLKSCSTTFQLGDSRRQLVVHTASMTPLLQVIQL